jgi:hypothetical protein
MQTEQTDFREGERVVFVYAQHPMTGQEGTVEGKECDWLMVRFSRGYVAYARPEDLGHLEGGR